MQYYTSFSSLVYLILTAGLKQNVFVFLKEPLGLTLILCFVSTTMFKLSCMVLDLLCEFYLCTCMLA